MRYYELMMVVPQTDDEGLSATLERVNNDIGERGGTVVRQERWGGLRRLAYPINDHNEGSYVLTHLELDPERAGELEANLRVSENILRHLLLRIDSIPEARVTPVQEAHPQRRQRRRPCPQTLRRLQKRTLHKRQRRRLQPETSRHRRLRERLQRQKRRLKPLQPTTRPRPRRQTKPRSRKGEAVGARFVVQGKGELRWPA